MHVRRAAPLALAAITLIWGYNWVVMKQVAPLVSPLDFSAIRTLLGAATLFAVMLVRRQPLRPVGGRQVLLLGLLQTAAFTLLIQWALVAGSAGRTAVLVYTMPFWLVPLSTWLLGERIGAGRLVAVAVAAAGLLLILSPWASTGSTLSNGLALLASLSWALATILAKRMRQQHDLDLLAMTAWQMLFGALALGFVALLVPSAPIRATPYFFGALAFNALFATGLAWLLWLYVLRHLPASLAGLASLGIPAVGVLAGWLELGERPTPSESAGMALIIVSLALLSISALRGRQR